MTCGKVSKSAVVYASLLTKTAFWAPEEELRFLSKTAEVEVIIDGSIVTKVVTGHRLDPVTVNRVREIAGSIPVVTRALAVCDMA